MINFRIEYDKGGLGHCNNCRGDETKNKVPLLRFVKTQNLDKYVEFGRGKLGGGGGR